MITKKTFEKIKKEIINKLSLQLPPDLYYHGVHHTMDVLKQAERIAGEEKVTNETDLQLLRIASLYHDSGFMFTYDEHEEASCNLAKKELPAYAVSDDEIDWICGMIMATRIPQIPLNHLERIICDADLDYLGRDDFFDISQTLYQELKNKEIINKLDEWNKVQVSFFKQHLYFTKSKKKLRTPIKEKHLKIIEESIK